MIDDNEAAETALNRECIQRELTKFHADLAAREDALAYAFHFDERDSVRPSYEALIRIPAIHDELLEQLKRSRALYENLGPEALAAHDETIRVMDGIVAMLRDIAIGIDHYHGQGNKLSRIKYELEAAIARLAPWSASQPAALRREP